jgi:hypothetical protein
MRHILYLSLVIIVSSCSSSKFIPSANFYLDSSVPIVVESHPISSEIEAVLLELGLNVVPSNYIIPKSLTEGKESVNNGTSNYKEEKYNAKYIPAKIFIEISGYDSMNFRIIDSETKKLLAIYKYRVDPNYESVLTKSPLKGFAKEIKKYIK